MPPIEIVTIGLCVFAGEVRPGGEHVDVTIRGTGAEGNRALCGRVVMSRREWESIVGESSSNKLVATEPAHG